jgi:hypothetical protein
MSDHGKDGPCADFVQANPSILNNVWFTAEDHYHPNVIVKQQSRIWRTENPNLYEDAPLHPVKCTV